MRVRGWKPRGFPIAALLSAFLLTQGGHHRSGATATASAEVSAEPPKALLEGAAVAWPSTRAARRAAATTPSASSGTPGRLAAPPSRESSGVAGNVTRRKRADIFPRWLKRYDVYEDLAALYGLDKGGGNARRSGGGEEADEASDQGKQRSWRMNKTEASDKVYTGVKRNRPKTGSNDRRGNVSGRAFERSRTATFPSQPKGREPTTARENSNKANRNDPKGPVAQNGTQKGNQSERSSVRQESQKMTLMTGGNVSQGPQVSSTNHRDIVSPQTPVSTKIITVSPTEGFYGETTTLTSMESEESGFATLEPNAVQQTDRPEDNLYDMIMKAQEESTIETPTMTPFADSPFSSQEQDFSFGNVDGLLAHISKLSHDGSDQIVKNKRQRLAIPLPNNPRLRLAHPENLTPSDIVQIIDADMLDVVADDQKDMAALAREDDEETREIGHLDLDDDESEVNYEDDDGDELMSATAPPREQEAASTEVDDDTLDETELRERYRHSEHEDVPDPPTRPNYTHEGLWAKPPPDVDIDFVPLQIMTQVRRYDTVRHLTPEDAIAEATTDEEEANAPRLKEVISHRKTSEVYSEEGYEDSGYDHGGYNKEGEHHEVVPGFEASAIMVKQPSAGEEVSESRDHMVSNSEPRGTRLAAPGAAHGSTAARPQDPARNKTSSGTQQITRGSWSIRQVAEDDAGRSVVLQEGGNITRPTTLRPVFPAGGRYAAHAQQAKAQQAQAQQSQAQQTQAQQAQAQQAQTQQAHHGPLREAAQQGTHSVRQSTPPRHQNNSTALQSKQKPSPKKLKRRRKRPKLRKSKRKKAQKVHSQLLGFKYPADRKKPISKGKSNSPLAKAKRKRKMKERAKKRRKMSLKKAEREKKRFQRLNTGEMMKNSTNNSTGKPSASPKESLQITNTTGEITKLVDPRTKSLPHFGNKLHPNHQHDKSTVNQKKFIASSRSTPPYNTLQNAEKGNSPWRTRSFHSNQMNWLPMEAENLIKPQSPDLHTSLSAKWAKEIEKRHESIHQPYGAHNAQETKPPKPVHFTVAALAAMRPNAMQANVAEATATHKLYDSQRSDKTFFGKASNTFPQFIGPFDKSQHLLGQTLPAIYWDKQSYNPVSVNLDLAQATSKLVTNPPTYTGNVDFFRAEDSQISKGQKLLNVLQDAPTLAMVPTARRFERSSELRGNSYDLTATSNAFEGNAFQTPRNETSRSNVVTRRTRFPMTEAIQRLERRAVSNFKTGDKKLKPISTNKVKHVPPAVNISNEKLTTNDLKQQKLRLLKVMDMDHWKTQSRRKSSNTSSDQLYNATYNSNENVSSKAPNSSQLLSNRTKTEETAYPPHAKQTPSNFENIYIQNATMETGHDEEQEASMRNNKFVLPDIRTDLQKYPFYRAPVSEKLSSYTPLRYATNPYDVPIKSEGGMEFYESREKLVRCEEPRKPENVVPERDEDGEWNKKPQPNGPRMGSLGDVIGCKRVQLFGENPLDNPFFKETSVGLPEETALIGALVDAGGTPAPKLHDQLGFYSDILENIRHASIGPNPAEVRNRPYIQVGSSPFDSDEASSEAINVRVAYNIPDNGKQIVYAHRVPRPKFTHSSNLDEDQHAGKVVESADVDYTEAKTNDDTYSKLAAELQDSSEEDSQTTDQTVKPDKDSSESTSVEYYVDVHGQPVYFYTGSTLEKSKESKKGVKDMVYHNIVRPVSSESVEYEVNTATKDPDQKEKDGKGSMSTGNKQKLSPPGHGANKSNVASMAIGNKDRNKKRKNYQPLSDSAKLSRQNSYKEALRNSKSVTDLKKKKSQKTSKFLSQNLPLPPISSSVLKELKNSNVTLENFLHSPPSREKNATQSLKEPANHNVNNHMLPEKSYKEGKRNNKQNSGDAVNDEEDIDSSESADFVRPKTKDVRKTPKLKTTYFIDEGGKFGSEEYDHGESYSFTEPLGGKPKKTSKKQKNKANDSKPVSLESSSKEDTTDVVGSKSIYVGYDGDSIVEVPLDSIEEKASGSKSNQNMKSASTEVDDVQHGTPDNEDLEDEDLEDADGGETPESQEKATDDEDDESSSKKDSDETSSENDKNKSESVNVVPKESETDEKNSTKEDGTTKQDGTESKPITFEEFKAGLSEDELAFFRDEDDDEDIGVDDFATEDEEDDDGENSKKPRKKTMKASKSIHIERHPTESEEFGGSSSRGALDSDEDKIIVNYTSNVEADFKPKKIVKVVRSQTTEEKHPEDDYEYYEDDDDDLDTDSEPPKRNNAEGQKLQSDSSETRATSKESSDTAKKPQEDDVLAEEPDDDSFDYYEDDDHDDYEDPGSEKNKNPSTTMSAEESQELPNLMVDTSTRGSNTAQPSQTNSQENNSDRSENTQERDGSSSSETEKGQHLNKHRGENNEDSQSNEGKEESSQEIGKEENSEEIEGGNDNKPNGPPNSNISSGDILPFESAESAVEQKTLAELAFDKKVEGLKASAGHPPELSVQASNTEPTKTALNSSLESLHISLINPNGSLAGSAPITRTQLGVSSMLNPFTTLISSVGNAEKPSATSSPSMTEEQWTQVTPPSLSGDQGASATPPTLSRDQGASATPPTLSGDQGASATPPTLSGDQGASATPPALSGDQGASATPPAPTTSTTRPPNFIVLKKPRKPTTSSVIMTIPASNSEHQG